MMVGITNLTNVSMQNLTDIVNVTSLPEFFIKVNHDIYAGWFWFIILCVLWVILYKAANSVRDQPLNNAMYSGAAVTILSFIMRGITITRAGGMVQGLLTDHQLWVFPLITIILATIIWAIKD